MPKKLPPRGRQTNMRPAIPFMLCLKTLPPPVKICHLKLRRGLHLKLRRGLPVPEERLSRVKAALPQSPTKFVETVNDIMQTATPRKKALFTSQEKKTPQFQIGEQVMERLSSLKKKRDKMSKQTRRCLLSVCKQSSSIRSTGNTLSVTRKTATKYVPASESSSPQVALTSETCNKSCRRKLEAEVSNFMESVSDQLPDRKLVSRKSGKAAAVLAQPLKELHADFVHGGHNISFSQFAKCRPAHIRPMNQCRLRQCLCEYCTNLELKLRVVNAVAARTDNNSRIRHKYHAVDVITCGRQADGTSDLPTLP